MGNWRRRRKPTLYSPSNVYFTGGLLLCFTFGMTLAGIEASYRARDWAWFTFFCLAELSCTTIYLCNVRWWLRWMNLSGDTATAATSLSSSHEHQHRTGDDHR